MGCRSCQEARTRVANQARTGNVVGTVRALTAGAVMMGEKLMGVDINAKYGVAPSQTEQKPYSRD